MSVILSVGTPLRWETTGPHVLAEAYLTRSLIRKACSTARVARAGLLNQTEIEKRKSPLFKVDYARNPLLKGPRGPGLLLEMLSWTVLPAPAPKAPTGGAPGLKTPSSSASLPDTGEGRGHGMLGGPLALPRWRGRGATEETHCSELNEP